MGFPGDLVVKNLPANAGDAGETGSFSWLGKSPGGGNDNPLQYSCQENPLDWGAWSATAHGVTKSHTRLRDWVCIQVIMYKINKKQWYIV